MVKSISSVLVLGKKTVECKLSEVVRALGIYHYLITMGGMNVSLLELKPNPFVELQPGLEQSFFLELCSGMQL